MSRSRNANGTFAPAERFPVSPGGYTWQDIARMNAAEYDSLDQTDVAWYDAAAEYYVPVVIDGGVL